MSTRATAARRGSRETKQPARPADLTALFTSESFVMDVLLLAAIVIAYYPVYQHPFFNFDDPVYVVNNPHIASGLSWDTAAWAFSTFYQFNWHPLTWISHAFDVQLFHLVPAGHHVMNVLLHAANVLLLCWVLRRATGYIGRSAVVAALFALHPINVETVAWVAERKTLLSMFFFLLGMGAYRWYASAAAEDAVTKAQRGRFAAHHEPRGHAARYVLMTLCFVLGLMAKPQIITFPFVLLLWDYWPLGRMATSIDDSLAGTETEPLFPPRSFWWLVKEKIPLFAICAASGVVTVMAQRAGGAVALLRNDPLPLRLTNAIVSYGRYLGKAVWPANLAPLYPHSARLPVWQVLLSSLVLLAITGVVIAHRKQRYLLVGWLWFLGTLVPMIGLVQVGNQAMADRYAYLPFIGLFIMVCWPVAEFAALVEAPIAVVRTVSVLVLLILLVLTDQQLGYWGNNVDLWRHTLAVTQGNYIAHDNLAHLLMDQGETDEALQHYRAALEVWPDDPNSLLALAQYDHQHGKLQDAIARYEQVVRVTPAGPARADLLAKEGLVYLDMQDAAGAQACFAQAVAMDSENVPGWLGLGVAAERSGDLQAAIKNYEHANSIRPLKVTNLLLAKALEESGDISAAQTARGRAKLLPEDRATPQTYSGGMLQR